MSMLLQGNMCREDDPLRQRPGMYQRHHAGLGRETGIKIDFIEPGNSQQNAFVARYNRTVGYDWLAHHLFDSIDGVAAKWQWSYDHERRNMAIGGITHKPKLPSWLSLYF